MSASFAYVGWNGRGNTGDDAIFQALMEALSPADVESFPVYASELLRAVSTPPRAGFRRSHLLLGGGTLIGRSVWRRNLRLKALPLVRRRPAFMVGVGVEDPSFQGTYSFSDSGRELHRWPAILRRFHRVTVRGPRSQELLAAIGIEADVVGDPALLLEPDRSDPSPEQVVGVTLGYGDDVWGHDHRPVEVAVASALGALAADGWKVRLLCMNEEDRPLYAKLADALSGTPIEVAPSAKAYLRSVSDCRVLVAERLHAMVLAAAAGTPFAAIEYQPKCRDFTASIDWDRWSVRTDSVRADELCRMVRELGWTGGAVEPRDRLGASVAVLRRRLRTEVDTIRTQVLGAA